MGAYILTRDMAIYSTTGNIGFDISALPDFSGLDIAVDLAVTSDGKGAYFLNQTGGLYTAGEVQASTDLPYFGWDIARDLEITPDNKGLYVLDGMGGIHWSGTADPLYGFSFGWDIARDLELSPDGMGAYILDGFGGLHSVGGATHLSSIYFGQDVAKSVKIRTDGGYYILDIYGNIYEFGGAPKVSDIEFGMDRARDLELVDPYNILVLDKNGMIYAGTEEKEVGDIIRDVTPIFALENAQDIELSGEYDLPPTPTATPTPDPSITVTPTPIDGTTAQFQEILDAFAEAYKNENYNAVLDFLAPDYSDSSHDNIQELTEDLIFAIDVLSDDIKDNNNKIDRLEFTIDTESSNEIYSASAAMSVDSVEVKYTRIAFPGTEFDGSTVVDGCSQYVDPEDNDLISDNKAMEFELFTDDKVIIRDFGNGLLTRLYILELVDVNKWDKVYEYAFSKSGDEVERIELEGQRYLTSEGSEGTIYSILLVDYDCSDQFDPPIPTIQYLSGDGDPEKTNATWEFELVDGEWLISSSGFLEKI